jgi:hypothetical protein
VSTFFQVRFGEYSDFDDMDLEDALELLGMGFLAEKDFAFCSKEIFF